MYAYISGISLRIARLNSGLTQKQLADMTNISVAYVSRIEKGWRTSISVSIIKDLAQVFNVPYNDLLVGNAIQPDNVTVVMGTKKEKTLEDWTTEDLLRELLKREKNKT